MPSPARLAARPASPTSGLEVLVSPEGSALNLPNSSGISPLGPNPNSCGLYSFFGANPNSSGVNSFLALVGARPSSSGVYSRAI